ncbi:MAG: DUF4340 domain-containing protein [Saprospiraceae bacterium]|nr:DUF4340 domain-containing protein [Saprospiraceae bacterium]
MNNKTLAIIFTALVVLYGLSKLLQGNKDRSFDPVIVSIDTSSIDKITIRPANTGSTFTLQRSGDKWTLETNGQQHEATNASVSSLLGSLTKVVAERIVSKNPEKQADYGVDETSATEIELFDANRKVSHIVAGRFSFNQATRSGISYLKHKEDDAVYAVDGFLSMSLTQGKDNYRDKTLTKFNTDDLTRITMSAPDAQIQYSKDIDHWIDENGDGVDSAKMSTFLSSLGSVSGTTFADQGQKRGEQVLKLNIEGNNMVAPVSIECYASLDSTQSFVIHSSLNPEADFYSDSSGIYSRIFQAFFTARESE